MGARERLHTCNRLSLPVITNLIDFNQIFVKMKQEPQGYNKTSDKLEFVRNTPKIM